MMASDEYASHSDSYSATLRISTHTGTIQRKELFPRLESHKALAMNFPLNLNVNIERRSVFVTRERKKKIFQLRVTQYLME